MKILLPVVCLLALASCAKAPDPDMVRLEARVKTLEEELDKTKACAIAVSQSQDTAGELIKIQGAMIGQMAPSANVEQLRQIMAQYIEAAKRQNDLQEQKFAIIAKQVFGETAAK